MELVLRITIINDEKTQKVLAFQVTYSDTISTAAYTLSFPFT